jgi:hypothetical protein
MLGTIHRLSGSADKLRIEVDIRKRLRMFCVLPWTCPNELTALLIGDSSAILDRLARVVEHKSNCRRAGFLPDWQYIQDMRIPCLKLHKVPRRLTRLIQLMYGQKCWEHSRPMNRAHLAEHHSIVVDPLAIL